MTLPSAGPTAREGVRVPGHHAGRRCWALRGGPGRAVSAIRQGSRAPPDRLGSWGPLWTRPSLPRVLGPEGFEPPSFRL